MSDIPIFDCLTHPALDGTWINPRWAARNSFENLAQEMQAANVPWCLAVAMGSTGGYDFHQYPQACGTQPGRLFPIAFLSLSDSMTEQELDEWIGEVRERGYYGIKIHPRLNRIDFGHSLLPAAIRQANRRGMPALLCTYFYSADAACSSCSPETLRGLLHQVPEERLILLHSGGVHLLEVSEMTRPFKRVLLDVSFTMCEYARSSLDLDLRYVFRRCHQRVCIGSDSPEIPLSSLRQRFEELTEGLEDSLRTRIAHQNLFDFLGLSP